MSNSSTPTQTQASEIKKQTTKVQNQDVNSDAASTSSSKKTVLSKLSAIKFKRSSSNYEHLSETIEENKNINTPPSTNSNETQSSQSPSPKTTEIIDKSDDEDKNKDRRSSLSTSRKTFQENIVQKSRSFQQTLTKSWSAIQGTPTMTRKLEFSISDQALVEEDEDSFDENKLEIEEIGDPLNVVNVVSNKPIVKGILKPTKIANFKSNIEKKKRVDKRFRDGSTLSIPSTLGSEFNTGNSQYSFDFAREDGVDEEDVNLSDKWWKHERIKSNLRILYLSIILVLLGILFIIIGGALVTKTRIITKIPDEENTDTKDIGDILSTSPSSFSIILLVFGLLFILPGMYIFLALYFGAVGHGPCNFGNINFLLE